MSINIFCFLEKNIVLNIDEYKIYAFLYVIQILYRRKKEKYSTENFPMNRYKIIFINLFYA